MDNTNNIITTNITEKELHPVTGMLMLIINIVGILFSMLLCVISPLLFYGAAGGLGVVIGVLLFVLFCIMFAGLKAVSYTHLHVEILPVCSSHQYSANDQCRG